MARPPPPPVASAAQAGMPEVILRTWLSVPVANLKRAEVVVAKRMSPLA